MDFTHELETQMACVVAYLRGELGYDSDSPGSLRRQVEENTHMIRTIDDALRGRGDELGVIGWMMVIRRTWITLVALLSAACGYLLNDVVNTVKADRPAASHRTFARE
jgi:hypothetical protein